ncbi:hypothetical protein BBJ28_00007688 [Nothophytophthora sp. Chile5]|nr:hypothetical protein BBJ28_00007688 [Nothophytophthora sp. Chile5]
MDEEERLQLRLAAEVRSLRSELRAREQEGDALQEQVAALTTQLAETSDELERRMAFVADAMVQMEALEMQVAEGKRSILTREMQLQEGEQRERALDAALRGKEKQCELWESEFHRMEHELTAHKQTERQLHTERKSKNEDARTWKVKLHTAMSSIDELKKQNADHRKKERELVATLRQYVGAAETSERSWKSRLAKRDTKIEALEKQCRDRHEELEHVERDRSQDIEALERHRLDAAEQQLDRQKRMTALRERMGKLTAVVEKAQAKEQLFRREIVRLREELLLSEAQRETEQRRQEQLQRGKEKEVSFIWQKYVEVMSTAEEVSQPMEELGFFNEREAECFEREDTLSLSDLEKLNVDENMPEMERTEKLLKTGLDKQKISVLSSLPQILANNNSKANILLVLDCMKGVWQKYESEMNANPAVLLEIFKGLASLACATVDGKVLSFPTVEFHEAFAQRVEVCREEKKSAVFLLTDEQVAKLLVPLALDLIAEIQQKDYAEEASLSVIALLPRIGTTLKKTQVSVNAFSLAIEKGDVSQTPGSRLICCLVLGAVTALNLLPAPDIEGLYFHKLIIPEFVNVAETHPHYLVHSLAEQYGNLVTKLAALNHLGTDTSSVFLQSYARLCAHEDIALRQSCAYNFPAIVKAFGSTYVSTLMDDLLVKLATDPVEEVRHHIAAGIHEVAALLGQQRALRYLKPLVLNLMNDESTLVQGMAISRAPQLLYFMISPNDEEQKVGSPTAALLDSIIKSIIDYHSILPASRNRDQLIFLETLKSFPSWFSSVQMYEMVVPIIFDLIEDGARPVQLLAMQVVLKYIRCSDVANHRYSLLSKLRTEYGHSKSYWRRLLYLDACVFALTLNSRQYCQRNFLEIAIDLLDDPVPNVRLKAISFVPQWKSALTYLSDEKALDRIRQLLDEATIDSDRDVANALHETRRTIEAANDVGQQRRPPEDVEDKRKLSEEENLGLMSDHEDSSADSKWSSMLEYTLVVGKDGQVVRRARVKSFDLVNKIARMPGKDTGRTLGINGGGNSSTIASALGMSTGGGSSMALGMGMGAKNDANRAKIAPKTPTKPAQALTTLPNCPTARPSHTKMPQAVKVIASTGKVAVSGSKSATGVPRSGTGLPKDTGAITKIPIIRPSAPAKREASPTGGTKPSNATLTLAPGPSSRLGTIDSSGVGALKPPKAAGSPAMVKR